MGKTWKLTQRRSGVAFIEDIIITKVSFSLGPILPMFAEDSSTPQPTAEDWSPQSIIVSSPLILSLSVLFWVCHSYLESVTAVLILSEPVTNHSIHWMQQVAFLCHFHLMIWQHLTEVFTQNMLIFWFFKTDQWIQIFKAVCCIQW